MNNVLVLSHGRNHRIIKEINYQTSKFLDPDPNSGSDYRISADYKYIGNIIKDKFDYIILAATPLSLQLSNIILDNDEANIDGELNEQLYNNIRFLLNDNGFILNQSPFVFDDSYKSNNQLYIDKMYKLGFVYHSLFEISIHRGADYVKLQKRSVPTKIERFNYLSNRLNDIYNVKIRYYSYVYDDEVSKHIKEPENIDEILPYKNLDEEDKDFVAEDEKYKPEDLLKLSYILNDDTKVILI